MNSISFNLTVQVPFISNVTTLYSTLIGLWDAQFHGHITLERRCVEADTHHELVTFANGSQPIRNGKREGCTW